MSATDNPVTGLAAYLEAFTQIYEALLNTPDLIEPELVELGRLVAKRLAACRQRRRAATTVQTKSAVEALHAWQEQTSSR